jgi:hypothetical protein
LGSRMMWGASWNYRKFVKGFWACCAAGQARSDCESASAKTRTCTGGSCAGIILGEADLPQIGAEPGDSILNDRFDLRARPSAGRGPEKGRSQSFGAYPWSLTTKIYELAGELGLSLAITITAGQVADRTTLSPCSESARRRSLSPSGDKIPMLWSCISRSQAPKQSLRTKQSRSRARI